MTYGRDDAFTHEARRAIWSIRLSLGGTAVPTGVAIGAIVAVAAMNEQIRLAMELAPRAVGVLAMAPDAGAFGAALVAQMIASRIRARRAPGRMWSPSTIIRLRLVGSAGMLVGMAFAARAGSYVVLLVLALANGAMLLVEPAARACHAAHVRTIITRLPERERGVRANGQDGWFSLVSTVTWVALVWWPSLLSLFGGFMLIAGVTVAAALVARVPSDASADTAHAELASMATFVERPLARRERQQLRMTSFLSGMAISMIVMAQGPIVAAKGGPDWLPIVIAVISAVVGGVVMPRWSRLAAWYGISTLRWANVVLAGAFLVLLLSSWTTGAVWQFVFIPAYAAATVAGAFGLITGFSMTRRSTPTEFLALAKTRFLAWRIAGVLVGRASEPSIVAGGLALAGGFGAQAAAALAGLLPVAGVVAVEYWYRRDHQEP